ncbi:MAG: NAD(P)/FAD-dependent oxidoreductase [Candidatus Thermoplasmatota archaeon]
MGIKSDVLIIGGGPAGLSAALMLSKKGISYTIVEKNDYFGSKLNEYDITEGIRINEILKYLNVKPNKISKKSEWFSLKNSSILKSKIGDFYFIRGANKDSIENKLLKNIDTNNLNVYYHSTIDSFKIRDNKIENVIINNKNEKIQINPKYIIIADGGKTDYKKNMIIKKKYFAQFNGFGVVIKTKEENIIPDARIYFDKNIFPGGYLYSGSIENNAFFCIVYDNIFELKINLQEYLIKFVNKIVKDSYLVNNYFSGFGISGIKESLLNNMMLIGGAAHFHDPFFGYGINYAIESAYFSSKSIYENDQTIYSKYVEKIHKEFNKRYIARRIFRKKNNEFYSKLIKSLNNESSPDDMQIYEILKIFEEE